MKLKKTIKKAFSNLIPKGSNKEYLKTKYYNLLSKKKIHYSLVKESDLLLFKTKFEKLTFLTKQPLYTITPDFDNYQFYYKVKKGDAVLDAGANVGILSILFSKLVDKNGHVYIFEPDQHNTKMLKDNLSLNKLQQNYSLHNELLWNTNDEIDFQESGTVASSALWFSGNENIVKKQTVTLDSWCHQNDIRRLDYIKMDIEGAEVAAVEGCKEVIKKFKPNVAIASYHMVNNVPTYIQLEAFFKSINYPFITKKFSGYEIITFAGPCIINK